MSTFIVNPNDTIVISDNVIIKTNKFLETLCPVVKEAETNGDDVTIAVIVCAATVLIVLIVAVVACLWRKQSKDEQLAFEEMKQTHEMNMKGKELEHKEKEDDCRKNQYYEKLAKEQEYENGKSDYQKYEEFVEKMVNLAKNKEGAINEGVLEKLMANFKMFTDNRTTEK